MKIESMDASGVSSIRPQEQNNPTKDAQLQTNDNKKKDYELDSVSISNMSPMEKKELPVAEKVVIEAIEKANKAISGGNRRFEFSIHAKTKEIMVKVIDSDTGDVLREIPPEKTLDMVARLWEMAGINVDERG